MISAQKPCVLDVAPLLVGGCNLRHVALHTSPRNATITAHFFPSVGTDPIFVIVFDRIYRINRIVFKQVGQEMQDRRLDDLLPSSV